MRRSSHECAYAEIRAANRRDFGVLRGDNANDVGIEGV